MLEKFESAQIATAEATIFVRWAGSGVPLLLLHGFPQTHLMWRDVAPLLARRFAVVCADLRGYGASGCPPSSEDHAPYSKRAMARDMVAVMAQLGFRRFAVAGHDRGGRVAYRLALDYPDRVERLALLDIVPTGEVWARADARLALAYWPWSLLAQPAPLPERLLCAAPDAVVDAALTGWGSPASAFGPEVRLAYIDALRKPANVHAICEEYRAAATLDWAHDQADRRTGRRIACPVLALWSGSGPLVSWYDPLELWRAWCDDVRGGPVDGGHFFPEERPRETAERLERFFLE
jgi:haloacetate dehalogenase